MRTRFRSAVGTTALISLSTVLALSAAEWTVGYALQPPERQAAKAAGVAWDERDRLDVLTDARATEPNWFPAVPANTYLERHLLVDGRRIVPLGGVANANVVGCNESGYFSTFSTDEFGFNNSPGALAAPGRKIFFLGDSFTQGDCLRQGETIVDRLRARWPATVNLGSGGNGPLLELAALREYVRHNEVALVVWMYYEGNDLDDIRRDYSDPILVRYLDPVFAQQLRSAQPQINDAVRAMVEERTAERLRGRPSVLPNLRQLLWRLRQGDWGLPRAAQTTARQAPTPVRDVDLLLEVIAAARQEVESKGGTFLLAYLPEYFRYAGPSLSQGAARRDQVLEGLGKLGVRVVDLHQTFARHPDPLALFPFRLKGHYNAAGAALVAEALNEALSK